jgi:hypothetical protein
MLIDQEGGEKQRTFEDPGENSSELSQSDILNLRDRGEKEAKTTLKAGEDSSRFIVATAPAGD